jgi:hypothetical protein
MLVSVCSGDSIVQLAGSSHWHLHNAPLDQAVQDCHDVQIVSMPQWLQQQDFRLSTSAH